MISFVPLWKTLEAKDMKKIELREKTGISKATFAKLAKNQSITLETIEKICAALGCGIEDVVIILPDVPTSGLPG